MTKKKTQILKFASAEQASNASVPIKDEYERLIYSEVYAPNRPDSDGCFMTAEVIKKMAHDFLASGRMKQVDLYHNNVLQEGCVIVESFIAREGDPTFLLDSWVVGIYIGNDEIWKAILDGTINGLSVQALVLEEEVEVTIANAGEVTGFTTTNDDHSHKFIVTYDEEGNFLGGKTDVVDGHYHTIRTGTATAFATRMGGKTHKHNFSYVDQLQIEE